MSRLTLVEELSPSQMEFIDFAISKYVGAGSEELDNEGARSGEPPASEAPYPAHEGGGQG